VELKRFHNDPPIDGDDEELARALHRLILECESIVEQLIAALEKAKEERNCMAHQKPETFGRFPCVREHCSILVGDVVGHY
jgi:hypothetical protein